MTAELKKWRHTFYSLSLNLKQYIHKFQRGKDLFITLSIVYIQISNAYLPEFLNISINVEANPVWICRQCLYSAVIFNSKLDYSRTNWNDFGVWSSFPLPNQLSASNGIHSLIELSLLFSAVNCGGIFIASERKPQETNLEECVAA